MSIRKGIYDAILAVGGDPADDTWYWLVNRGPYGSQFTWTQTRQDPSGYVGIEHLQRIIAELEPLFRERLNDTIAKALTAADVDLLRRAIQVGATVGDEAVLHQIQALTSHTDDAVANDAKASSFYLKKRLRAIDA